MLLHAQTKDKCNIHLDLNDVRSIESKQGNYIRIHYRDGNTTSLAYNNTSFDFKVDYIVDIQEINRIIIELEANQ